MGGWYSESKDSQEWKGTLKSDFKGTTHQTPEDSKDIINKGYVDDNIPAAITLYMTENASDIATYFDVEPSPVTDAEENIITAIAGSSPGTLLASYASVVGCGCISGLVELPVGVWAIHIHCEASALNSVRMYAELYHRTALGAETLLSTSEESNIISTAKGSIAFHGTITTEQDWVATDRIVVKLYGTNSSPASRNLTIYTEGTTASRIDLPAVRPTPQVGVPVGSIQMYGGAAAPTGWLRCNGAALDATTDTKYVPLFAAIGNNFGGADNTDFEVPDLRGIFPRGAGDSGKLTAANGSIITHALGTYSNDAMQGHKHRQTLGNTPGTVTTAQIAPNLLNFGLTQTTSVPVDDGTNGAPRTGAITKPPHVGVTFIIKY